MQGASAVSYTHLDVYKRQSLDRRIDGIALCISAYGCVAGVDIGQETFAVEMCIRDSLYR